MFKMMIALQYFIDDALLPSAPDHCQQPPLPELIIALQAILLVLLRFLLDFALILI